MAPSRAECWASAISSCGVRAEASSSAGFQAQAAHETVRGVVEVPDQRSEAGCEGPLRGRDDLGHRERAGDRPVLRDQLTDDHEDHGGEGHTEEGGDRGHGAYWKPHALQRAAQQHSEGRLGQHADDQRGHGDAELGAGELEGEPLGCLERALGTTLPGLHGAFELAALDGRERELGGDEHGTGQCQREGEEEKGHFAHRVTSVPRCVGSGMTRFVLGGSPIAVRSSFSVRVVGIDGGRRV